MMPIGCQAMQALVLLIMMVLQLCGDVHLQTGPLHVESVNVTSLRRYRRQAMTSKADVLCLQETRLTASGQRAMAALARRMGWRALWGAPLENKGGGFWDTALGGLGELYRPGMVIQPATRRPDDEDTQALWQSGRWMHAHMAHAEGKAVANIMVVYGIAG